jgi:hypothetical protein
VNVQYRPIHKYKENCAMRCCKKSHKFCFLLLFFLLQVSAIVKPLKGQEGKREYVSFYIENIFSSSWTVLKKCRMLKSTGQNWPLAIVNNVSCHWLVITGGSLVGNPPLEDLVNTVPYRRNYTAATYSLIDEWLPKEKPLGLLLQNARCQND